MVLPSSRGMAAKWAELTRESIGPQEPTEGEELAGVQTCTLQPPAGSQEAATRKLSRPAGGEGRSWRSWRSWRPGRWHSTRACVAVSDAVRIQCRDHSTAGLARSSLRERPGGLIVDAAAAGGRRRQARWRSRYLSGTKREGTAAAEALGKSPPPPLPARLCESTRRLRPSASPLAGRPGLRESWVPGRQGHAGS